MGTAAMGNNGNVICVNPAKKLVLAVAARFKSAAKDIQDLIMYIIEPAFGV